MQREAEHAVGFGMLVVKIVEEKMDEKPQHPSASDYANDRKNH